MDLTTATTHTMDPVVLACTPSFYSISGTKFLGLVSRKADKDDIVKTSTHLIARGGAKDDVILGTSLHVYPSLHLSLSLSLSLSHTHTHHSLINR